MLTVHAPEGKNIIEAKRVNNSLLLVSKNIQMRISPVNERTVRIACSPENFPEKESLGIVTTADFSEWSFNEYLDKIQYQSAKLRIDIAKSNMTLSFFNECGQMLLTEDHDCPRSFEKFDSYIIDDNESVISEKIQTADGVKQVAKSYGKKFEGSYYHIRMNLKFSEGEALYGLGQHEEGNLNLRGKTVYAHQANRKIAIPVLVSSLGYGILTDTYSPFIFSDNEFGSYIYTEADEMQDFYFLNGGNMDGVIKEYRMLTGKAKMLPKWAYGYIQSLERYETAKEMMDIADEFRKRHIGLDCLVLDWMSWRDGLWGQKEFDPERFPDPKMLTDTLHKNNVKMMMSVWPNADEKSSDYAEFKQNGVLLPASSIYNPFIEKGRKIYWRQAQKAIYDYGVDAWWCDSSEGYTPEWNHGVKPEPMDAYREFQTQASKHIRASLTNSFGLYHGATMHDGQTSCDAVHRVVNLTRSGYTGSQRFGAILWSGDISASWDTLKKQIAAGLNFCASGLPYWTTDAGAFFVKRGWQHYWNGDYPDGTEDLGYCELYTRWLQWSCFCPVFRSHGTDCRREPWAFENKNNNVFYNAIKSTISLRYALMPYIYSQAYRVWKNDESMISMLAFQFAGDENVLNIKDQYMFGDSIMVCPVTEPMYFEKNSLRIETKHTRAVYFPKGCEWYDYYSGTKYAGGTTAEVAADIDTIPLFVKSGSIIPTCAPKEYAAENTGLFLRVYGDSPADFVLYDDEGDGFDYENADHSVTIKYDGENIISSSEHIEGIKILR